MSDNLKVLSRDYMSYIEFFDCLYMMQLINPIWFTVNYEAANNIGSRIFFLNSLIKIIVILS